MDMIQKYSLNNGVKLNNDKMLYEYHTHKVIFDPNIIQDMMPISCEYCTKLYRTVEDEISYINFGCCDLCSQLFVRPNLEKWNNGWRPTKLEIEDIIKQHI
jgi:hypothetical protein